MKNLLWVVLLFALGGIASGQTYRSRLGGEKVRAAATPPPAAISKRGDVEGAVPRGVRGGNPLQMLNPVAPAKYGTAEQSVMIDPYTGKWRGIKLFEIIW